MMEALPKPETSLGRNLSDGTADLDLLDQLLSGDGWLEFPDCSDGLQAGTPNSMSPFNCLSFSPLFEVNNNSPNPDQLENGEEDGTGMLVASTCPPRDETLYKNVDRIQYLNSNSVGCLVCPVHTDDLSTVSPSFELGTSWCIQPKDSNFSVKDRFMQALNYIKETQRDGDVLVQLWVPVKRGDQLFLTTYSQPFSLNQNCEKLVNYREVSTTYHFSAEVNSGKALGLPGRVYLGKLPEWTPDVRFFSSYEYPRVDYAQRLDIRGSIALPVFDHGNGSCLGVVEVIMTTQKINYTFELENICNALQAVDLRTLSVVTVPRFKVSSGSYQAALPEIREVLKAVCRRHMLPLAQTWIPCIQQGKRGIRHSNENYRDCVSTADAACYVNDPSMMGFYEACSEHHLLKGQGVAGTAFTTNQPCFVPDVTASSKTEYPLSHHAKMFHLKGAVAIRLRSILTGNADFVLEFFLPTNCIVIEEQKLMLDSLSSTVQQVCQTLRVLAAKELAEEDMLQVNKVIPADFLVEKSSFKAEPAQNCETPTLLETHTTGMSEDIQPCFGSTTGDSKQKTRHIFEFKNHEIKSFHITTDRDHVEVILPAEKISSKLRQHQQVLAKDISDNENSFNFDNSCSEATKTTEKKRRKTEKTVSLEVLRKYFAGSLKDAAKSIGVCPTTLKRICRQHGITRWPSRKIKKVDHSLKKLQVVINSVHGADKAIQLSSLYKDFTTASVSDKNSSGVFPVFRLNQNDDPNYKQDGDAKLNNPHISSSHSSSSFSHTSTSSLSSSSGEKHCTLTVEPRPKQEAIIEEKVIDTPHSVNNKIDLHLPTQSTQLCPNRFPSQKSHGEHCSSGSLSPSDTTKSDWIRVKATYDAEKVRIRLHPTWTFEDLRLEILKRFNVETKNSVNLKYLDDESEWVLLTCDADLQECIHLYASSEGKHAAMAEMRSVTGWRLRWTGSVDGNQVDALISFLGQYSISEEEEQGVWRWNSNGSLSTTSLYGFLAGKGHENPPPFQGWVGFIGGCGLEGNVNDLSIVDGWGAWNARMRLTVHVAERGFRPVVFEAEPGVGGLWTHTLESTRLQSPTFDFQFIDFPWPATVTDVFPRHERVMEYVEAYARHFDLLRWIEFESTVVSVEYVGPPEEEMSAWELWAGNGEAFGGAAKGEWHVAVQHKGHDSTEICRVDFLILCIGRFSGVPNFPSFPPEKGPRVFDGKVIHSMDYSNLDNASAAALIKGNRVTIFGSGKTAFEIASECADANGVGLPCTMMLQTKRWFLDESFCMRFPLFGYFYRNRFSELLVHKPGEGVMMSLLATFLAPLRWLFSKITERYFTRNMPLKKHGMVPEHSFFQSIAACLIALVPEKFYDRVEEGSIVLKRPKSFNFYKNGLVIDNKDEVVESDLVIFATGFKGDQKLKDKEQVEMAASSKWTTVRRKNSKKSVSFAEAPKPSAPRWVSAGRSYAEALRYIPRPQQRPISAQGSAVEPISFSSFFGRLKLEGKCFRCFREGHLSFQCRNRARCFKCRGVGHLGYACKVFSLHRGQPSRSSSIPPTPLNSNSEFSMPSNASCSSSLLHSSSVLSSNRDSSSHPSGCERTAPACIPIAAKTRMADRPPLLKVYMPNSDAIHRRSQYLGTSCILVRVCG
ncbi:hypothetical protein Cni_G03482 [Canna indica]|uniref:Flavin-containing monooxygenase n=1 Tax=Canna indica TaxID=4628 RepID=A0AAQ3Q3K2_9LILI|nr:hypothetical protein Cni_G03482 [Canna indica]